MIIHAEYFCISCLRHRQAKHFAKWLEKPTNSRKCDCCLDGNSELINATKEEREAKQTTTKPRKTDVTKAGKKRMELLDKLYDIEQQKRIDEEIGL